MACSSSMPKVTPGAYVKDVSGPAFQEMELSDSRNSLLYFYRPVSLWAEEELEAPSIFVDGKPLVALKSGQYVWLENPAGELTIQVKRSVWGIFFRQVAELKVKVKGGTGYFVRYQEVFPGSGNQPDFRDSPLQLVDRKTGLAEVTSMRLDQPGFYRHCETAARRWATFLPVSNPKFAAKCEFKSPEIKSVQPK